MHDHCRQQQVTIAGLYTVSYTSSCGFRCVVAMMIWDRGRPLRCRRCALAMRLHQRARGSPTKRALDDSALPRETDCAVHRIVRVHADAFLAAPPPDLLLLMRFADSCLRAPPQPSSALRAAA